MSLVTLILAAVLSMAHAEKSHIETVVTKGPEAEAMYKSMRAQERNGIETETSSEKVKFIRSSNGLEQTACYRKFSDLTARVTYKCVEERSLDGKQLPEVELGPKPRQ